jgi:hypothetical protein
MLLREKRKKIPASYTQPRPVRIEMETFLVGRR